jgi:D-3-phosphoglycerate dehydrogenase
MSDFRILIATSPFGKTGRKPLDLLEKTGWKLVSNPYNRRLKPGEVGEMIHDVDAVIAGTEPYDSKTLKSANRLKVISRVGIGLDSVDLRYCNEKRIQVAYTPDAPSQGVAELTVAHIINLARHVHVSDTSVREGAWNRLMGKLVSELKVGVIGVGRIGRTMINLLRPFQPSILANDLNPDIDRTGLEDVHWCDIGTLLCESDIITLHIPMNESNRNFIGRQEIAMMKTGAMIINTARGGILDEKALVDGLRQKHLAGAALDVFEHEPYEGLLTKMDNVILTAHMGASAHHSRYLMELGAAEQCIGILKGEEPVHNAIADELGLKLV